MMFLRRQPALPSTTAVVGRARVGRRTKDLIRRVEPGEIAVIDHEDLDRLAAEGLIRTRAGAIVNASKSMSGRYPNVGPLLIAAAGIPLLDNVGPDVMDAVENGQVARLEGSTLYVGSTAVASGTIETLESIEEQYERAKANLGSELEAFAENTLEYLRKERHVVLESPTPPTLNVSFAGRHVLIVVRGQDYREDLVHLRTYVRELRPVLIGVDGGADALLEVGMKPDVILGDFDSVSDEALTCGAELVVHAYRGGDAPGARRLERLGADFEVMEWPGTSEDIAMLLAYEQGAELIVAVGTHASMVEFLDKGRAGMASTFLVRLKVGPILMDAKGVSRLYRSRVRKSDLTFLIAAAMIALLAMVLVSYPLRSFLGGLWFVIREWWEGLLT